MFSGIRYILGYSDETDATSSDGSAANQPNSAAAPSAVLEQTLNAATTKFTEQLLPQQSSIEQLQSSSHQLLPSITEQHEENELKKQTKLDDAVEAIQLEAADDDDTFVADSWELLDLVENVDEQSASKASRSSSVQKDATSPGLQKSTSGILKSSNASVSDTSCQQSRHKPKVSFETPDLVSSKQEIEQTKATDPVSSSSKKGKSKKNKRNSKANVGDCKTENQQTASSDVGSPKVDYGTGKSGNDSEPAEKLNEENPSLIVATEMTETTPFEMIVAKPIKPTTLNYAKALSAKPKSDVVKKEATITKDIEQTGEKNVKEEANKPMKRNRPTSTSSWSSSDEVETVEKCVESVENHSSLDQVDVDWCVDNEDDKLSLASSGFSDCDYGYGGINDYVMRPKKAGTRRQRTQSGSSGSFRAPKVARGHSTKHAGAATSGESTSTQGECSKSFAKKTVSTKPSAEAPTLSKNSRPKKKKLILTITNKGGNLTDFLKPHAANKEVKTRTSKFLEPKSIKQPQQSPSSSSNDSNEFPEMDESWYVTPPPCFTGASKQASTSRDEQQPKAVEAARENALIEHPSIYIASSSKSVASDGVSNSRIKKSPRQPLPKADPSAKKAWNNKFNQLLDDWDLDGQEDADSDFDTMFEPVKKKKNKAKKVQQQPKPQKMKPASVDLQVDIDTDSDEQISENIDDAKQNRNEESNSVELISIRSLSMENSLDIENVGFKGLEEDDNRSDETAAKPQKRQPIKVRPIEPERRPGWQLKKQRSKRRPLAVLNVDTKRQSTDAKQVKSSSSSKCDSPTSSTSSSRSTPTFMDRIGSSIVANLTNLTSGLVSSGALNTCSPVGNSSPLVDGSERAQQTVVTRSKGQNLSDLNVRKQLSRSSLKRQNVTAQQANMQRRPDRRLKMFATPNGSSVNRKVHANIH